MNNGLYRVWLCCFLALLTLISLRYLPEFRLFGTQVKAVDLLADWDWEDSRSHLPGNVVSGDENPLGGDEGRSDQYAHVFRDSLSPDDYRSFARSKDALEIPIDAIPIEDYGEGSGQMRRFYESLTRITTLQKSVHVGFFGDSFIEGDLITDQLRDSLQTLFGGAGIGFVPIASPINLPKTTIIQNASGFSTRSAVDQGRTGKIFGVSGYLAIPTQEKNQVTYSGVKTSAKLQHFDRVTLYYQSAKPSLFHYSTGKGSSSKAVSLSGGTDLQTFSFAADSSKRVSFSFPMDSALNLHGLSFESGPGVYIDNFGLRGNSGHALSRSNTNLLKATDSLLDYGLLIVQYGLNVLSPGQLNYNHYAKTLRQVIQTLKTSFPESSILIIGVGDRSTRKDGDFLTMEGLENLVSVQRQVAKDEGVAFWDMYEAMGGPQSMVRFVHAEPSLANKDYTHINRRGGKLIANQLMKAILQDYSTYLE